MGKAKTKRKPSKWNLFIKKHAKEKKFQLPSGSPDLKKMSAAFKRSGGGSSKPRAKPKKKSTTRRVTTTSRAKPVKTTRRAGPMERKAREFKKEFDDVRRALGVPSNKSSFKLVAGKWILKAGPIKVKRVKLSEAIKDFRKKAKKRL